MPLFGPPSIERLKEQHNIKGLIRATDYKRDATIRRAAVQALIEMGHTQEVVPILREIGDAWAVERLVALLCDQYLPTRGAVAGALDEVDWQPDRSQIGAAYWIAKCKWDKCVEIGTPAVEPLIAILNDRSKSVRQGAVEALGQISDARAVEPLIAILGDTDKDVRQAATEALIILDHTEEAAEALAKVGDAWAVDLLIYVLTRRVGSNARHTAAKSLAQIGGLAVEPLITAVLQEPRYASPAYEAAAEALARIGEPAAEPLVTALSKFVNSRAEKHVHRALVQIGGPAVVPLISSLTHRHSTRAAQILGDIGDARAVEPLIASLKDFYDSVRLAAAKALDRLDWQPDSDEVEALYWIAKLQWDKCVEVGAPAVGPLLAFRAETRWAMERAAETVARIGSAAIEPAIAALQDHDAAVRQAAASALEKLGWEPGSDEVGAVFYIASRQWDRCVEIGRPAVESLISFLPDADEDVRASSAEALGEIGDARAIKALTAICNDQSATVRQATISALDMLSWQPDSSAIKRLIKALKDEARRQDAAKKLQEVGAPAVEYLIPALRDRNVAVRQVTMSILGEIGDERAIRPLIAALLGGNPAIRGTAVDAMIAIGPLAVSPLMGVLIDRGQDSKLRIRAALLVGLIGRQQVRKYDQRTAIEGSLVVAAAGESDQGVSSAISMAQRLLSAHEKDLESMTKPALELLKG